MAQTFDGAKKAAGTNKSKYGSDYYAKIGSMGGKKKVPKGFAVMDKDKVREAGRKGGAISRRGQSIKHDMGYEDITKKSEYTKRIYDTGSLGMDDHSLRGRAGKLLDKVVGR